MCSDFKLLDTVALQNRITTNNSIAASKDNRYCVIVEDGLYVLQLCGLMDNISPCLSLKRLFIKVIDFALSSHLGIELNKFIAELPQFELYEAVLRLDISEELTQSSPVKQQPVQVKWSPLGIISNGHCALASLTNTGTLSVFVRTVSDVELEEFISVVNISKLCVEFFKPSWADFEGFSPSIKLDELKRRAEQVTPSAFTWSHLITSNDKKFCLFIVGHLNGGVTVWKFDARKANNLEDSGTSFLCFYDAGLKKITSLHWQQAGNNGLLIVGDIEGKVKAVGVTDITSENITFASDIWLWNQPDDMRIDHFNVLVYDKMIYVLIVKGSFLLICLLNESGEFLDIHNFHAGNFQITGVEHFIENIFLVLTYTGILKELKLSQENNKIRVDWRHIYTDFKWSSYHTHGIIVSPNKVFIGVLVSMSKLKDIKKRKDPVRLLIFMNMGKDPLAVLMKNTTESLMTYWDCLEILRLDGLIERKLPCDGLPAGLDYDKLSLLQLKTCLWLAKSSEMMYGKMYSIEDYNILRYDEFKYIVKIKLAMDHMHHLLELITDGKELSEFHMQSLDILNMFLKEIIVDDTIPQLGLGKNTIDELYDIISAANELQYPTPPKCIWCEENIIGLSCVPPHADMRCCLTFMPIEELPYYKCSFCACILHDKLTEVYAIVLCPYCDIPTDLVSVLTPNIDTIENVVEDKTKNISNCRLDCVKETIALEEIENHAFTMLEAKGESVDLVQFSSSDDQDKTDDNTMEVASDVEFQETTSDAITEVKSD